jgi:hypothetical protein
MFLTLYTQGSVTLMRCQGRSEIGLGVRVCEPVCMRPICGGPVTRGRGLAGSSLNSLCKFTALLFDRKLETVALH